VTRTTSVAVLRGARHAGAMACRGSPTMTGEDGVKPLVASPEHKR
jgi:hypothetical protein